MVSKYNDVFSGVFLLIVSVVMFMATFSFKALTTTFVGPAFMPQIISVTIAIFSLVIIASGFKKASDFKSGSQKDGLTEAAEEKGTGEEVHAGEFLEEKENGYKAVLITLAAMAIYIFLIPIIGFLITTTVYLFVQMLILCHKTKIRMVLFAVISVVSSVLIYYLFRNVFFVMLPTGIIG
ncbi:tripartite tricarboxylate transporter TctB family protein [Planococcus halotolerans]|uniref:tripartite tricarboxylate transporter TctB family protein n=1 Tax=Planococcus halotolerans TaxID=2233542 RepID=UPI001092A31D|nr:tripartite tricarboxylate transporter TctB family protein [Planococcus halotolerans]QHJ70111.1 hypothetical protein DNR44_005635 [Planococcus halotolerans]